MKGEGGRKESGCKLLELVMRGKVKVSRRRERGGKGERERERERERMRLKAQDKWRD